MDVREATPADAELLGRLMHDFSTEYDDLTPGPAKFAERFRELLAGEETAALLPARTAWRSCASGRRSTRRRSSATWPSSTSSPTGAGRASGGR